MKVNGLNVLAAFLGGAAVGAACGVLFAPEKGTDTRNRIAEVIRKRGIKLNSKDMESLVDDIADELQPANDWCNTTQESGEALSSLCGSPFLDSIFIANMFSSDKNIDIITQLVGDIKKDVTLR